MKIFLLTTITIFLIFPVSANSQEPEVTVSDELALMDFNSTDFTISWIEERGYRIALERLAPQEKSQLITGVASALAPCELILDNFLNLNSTKRNSVYNEYLKCADTQFEKNPTNKILFQLMIGLLNENEKQSQKIEEQTMFAYVGIGIGIAGAVVSPIFFRWWYS